MLQSKGRPLTQALQILRQALPPQAVLVGQGILHDVDWLDLKEGNDFQVQHLIKLANSRCSRHQHLSPAFQIISDCYLPDTLTSSQLKSVATTLKPSHAVDD